MTERQLEGRIRWHQWFAVAIELDRMRRDWQDIDDLWIDEGGEG